jgi:hypothetical protein
MIDDRSANDVTPAVAKPNSMDVPTPSRGCRVDPVSSRVCELGVKSCTTYHPRSQLEAAPVRTDLGEPTADEYAEYYHGARSHGLKPYTFDEYKQQCASTVALTSAVAVSKP